MNIKFEWWEFDAWNKELGTEFAEILNNLPDESKEAVVSLVNQKVKECRDSFPSLDK